VCGDGFRTAYEQCDDGNTLNGDACSSSCKLTPSLVTPRGAPGKALPPAGRELGLGRHPLAAGCNVVGVSVIDRSSEPAALKLATFSNVGVAGPVVEYGAANVGNAAPVVAAFADDTFAVAWTDFDGDGDELGIQLRKVDPAALVQAPAVIANANTAFSQRAPDVVFDGNELVVAWVDDSDPVTGPDLRYRLFDADLSPKSDDLTLAATGAVESGVALAAFGGTWAAAWRSGSAGMETIEVQSGASHWSVGPFLPAGVNDRPALQFVDATHLALAFTEGTDPSASGTANTPRLYGAIVDAAYPGATLPFPVAPTVEPYASTPTLSQTEPDLAVFADRLTVAWRSSTVPGNAQADELWTRELKWSPGPGNTLTVDTTSPEYPLLASAGLRAGDQGVPALLRSRSWPEHRMMSAWQDWGGNFRAAGAGIPDVGLQFAPAQTTDARVDVFPLSADGNYYNVNVLRRAHGYAVAQVSATYTNGATAQNQSAYAPARIFDGSDESFRWITPITPGTNTPIGPDPDATVVTTLDLGRVVQLGAMRQYFVGGNWTPVSFQLRLAQTVGQWSTVIPQTNYAVTTPANDTISEFPAFGARYVELTFVGTSASGQVHLNELFLYPSAQASPPPSTAEGYDLTYLPTVTGSSGNVNLQGTANALFDKLNGGFNGRTIAQGANADGSTVIDLGAWYTATDLALCFRLSQPWVGGGLAEISADGTSWTAVTNVPRGTSVGPSAPGPMLITFPGQTLRYVRITDYFTPGVGTSTAALDEVQIF
jgi:cysteine-rich repeat protein